MFETFGIVIMQRKVTKSQEIFDTSNINWGASPTPLIHRIVNV